MFLSLLDPHVKTKDNVPVGTVSYAKKIWKNFFFASLKSLKKGVGSVSLDISPSQAGAPNYAYRE
jgi:hypothetical protein